MSSRPYKVLQFGMCPLKESGGIESYLINQYRSLTPGKFVYDFIAMRDDLPLAFEDEFVANGSKVYRLKDRRITPFRYYISLVKLFWRIRGQYDVLVGNASALTFASLLPLGQMARIPCRIYHSHTSKEAKANGRIFHMIMRFDRILIRHFATHYFACSQKAGEWMFDKGTSFRIVNNAIDSNRYLFSPTRRERMRSELSIGDSFVVGMVGNFYAPKNHQFAVRVFHEILKRRPNAIFLLCGKKSVEYDTSYEDLMRYVEAEGLSENVRNLGFRQDICEVLQAMDVFLMPSLFEGLPLSAIEAQMSSLPCFLATTIAPETAITDFVTFLPLSLSAKEWAERILGAIGVERRAIPKADLARLAFDAKAETAKLEAFFLSVLEGGNRE